MIKMPITKIQILADRESGHPIFYCHSEDRDHEPELTLEKKGTNVLVQATQTLFKLKFNPQTKNRVDIYMSIENARALGLALIEVAESEAPVTWQESKAKPGLAAKGNMKLPNIAWSKYGRFLQSGAQARTGLMLKAANGYINVDLEFPDESHIKMKHYEIHMGIQLGTPAGIHDDEEAIPVHVPEEEFQKGRQERNPLRKTRGDFFIQLGCDVAAGLGVLLRDFKSTTL